MIFFFFFFFSSLLNMRSGGVSLFFFFCCWGGLFFCLSSGPPLPGLFFLLPFWVCEGWLFVCGGGVGRGGFLKKPTLFLKTPPRAAWGVLGPPPTLPSQADKGDFLVICRDFFGSVQMIIFIIHSVFVLYFLVEIAMVKFTILHPAFKLFLYVFKWTFYLSFFKRPVAWACI